MSFYIGPNTQLSYTGELFRQVAEKIITPERATILFFQDNKNMNINDSKTFEFIKGEFNRTLIDNSKCGALTKTKRLCQNKMGKCRFH